MPLAEYLASEQAREDVKALLADSPARDAKRAGGAIWRKPAGQATRKVAGFNIDTMLTLAKKDAWNRVRLSQRDAELLDAMAPRVSAYYRPDGDRYVVTDLGEGVRALRLKGVGLREIKPRVDAVMTAMWQEQTEFVAHFPAALIEGEIGTVNHPKADQLPDAICRVMLASLRVAQS